MRDIGRGAAPGSVTATVCVSDALLAWFLREGRSLPWRTNRSPFFVVVSEFMLQQTQVERVIPIFERFVAAFPGFAVLAAADRGAVVRAWQGLGYNSRAVRLQSLARAVCELHGGILPSDEAALRALPGVGPYTASAIRAFAFDEPEIALDTNITRILQRSFFGPAATPRRAELAASAAVVVTLGGNAANSALMDLGSKICTARAPKCLLCPISRHCKSSPFDADAAQRVAPRAPRTGPRFEETTRYLRGRIVDRLRGLPPGSAVSLLCLHTDLAGLRRAPELRDVERAATALAQEGVVAFDGTHVSLDAGALER